MTALLRPEDNARPWLPATDVKPVSVYDRWNIPLAGLIEQGGSRFLFTCLLGEEDSDNLWAYVRVSEDDETALEEVSGDDFLSVVEATLANRPVVVAFADEWKLITWHTIDAGEEGVHGIMRRFVNRWQNSLREQQEQANELSHARELVCAS